MELRKIIQNAGTERGSLHVCKPNASMPSVDSIAKQRDSFLDFCNAQSCADCPRDNVLAERYDVSEFFIKFPRGLPIEMKGIAV
jgi:hypothetical protein